MRRLLTICMVLVAAVTLVGSAFASQNVTITDLAGGGVNGCKAHAQARLINDHGQVVVSCNDAITLLWQTGTLTKIGNIGGIWGPTNVARAINQEGQIAGISSTGHGDHAYLWKNGVTVDLGTLPGGDRSYAGGCAGIECGPWGHSLNDRGEVVGSSYIDTVDSEGDYLRHAFLWRDGTMLDLGPSAESNSEAIANNRGQVVLIDYLYGSHLWQDGIFTKLPLYPVALNERGQVAGHVFEDGVWDRPLPAHAAVWQNGTLTMLGELPGDGYSAVIGINDAGEIIGVSYASADLYLDHPRGFMWRNGVMTDLGTLAGADVYTYPSAINNRGQVVGSSVAGDTPYEAHAFLWQNGAMVDLGVLPGATLSGAFSINARGQIVGFSAVNNPAGYSTYHAVLWDVQGSDSGAK